MYEKFYNLSEKPFNTTPDSKFFFPSNKHTEALNSLLYAINEQKGFVAITGEIGAGKTTVYRTLLNKLGVDTKVATIVNTHLTPKELIAEILQEFEIEHNGGTKQRLLSHLNQYLIRQLTEGINIVLIIDEAQNLTPKTLEEVRMLSNLETEKEKLIQIILIGQPQLKAKLENPKLEQFRQRIAVYYHLQPLNKKEVSEYITHRLKLVSSNTAEDLFTPEALELIYSNSRGIPRLINLICDSALLSGFVYETSKITEKIIKEVLRERNFHSQPTEENIHKEEPNQHPAENVIPEIKGRLIQQKPSQPPKIYCCPDCKNYIACDKKWLKGIHGEEQLCCPDCQNYQRCMDAASKVIIN